MAREPEPALSSVHNTALGAAAMRANHVLYDGEPKVLNDEYAQALTGWTNAQVLDIGDRARAGLAMPTTWITRGRFAEDRLGLARARGVEQYVVLGAGLDSYALRQGDNLGRLIVYEVD